MFRPLALAASVLLITACEPVGSTSITVTSEPVALYPDEPERETIGSLRYTGGLVISSDHDRFGGWSGMELNDDATRLLAISDRASWMTASLRFDDGGQLAGLTDVLIAPIVDSVELPLGGNEVDAEGIASVGNGVYVVSYERLHRIEHYDLGEDWQGVENAMPYRLFTAPGAERLRGNAGVEGLATADGILWAGIEYPIVEGRPHTLWRFDLGDENAEPVSLGLNLTPGFGLTALDVDDEGGLFVVERFYARDVGNRIRIGHLPGASLDNLSGPLTPTLLAELTPDMTVDNIEAIAMARIDGETRLFLMSDDNFNGQQRTLLLSFVAEN